MNIKLILSPLSVLVILLCSHLNLLAQQPARTFYFMDNAPIRLGLNPAMQPIKGYFSFPFLGAIGVSAVSNSINMESFTDIIDEKNDFLEDKKFMDRLQERNFVNADLLLELISFGFYSGKGFWTFDISTKVMLNTSIPKSIFEFVQNSGNLEEDILNHKNLNYDIRDMRLHLNAFGQIGLGYSRPVCSWLTVGTKLKFLVGLANLQMKIDQMSISTVGNQWLVETQGRMDASIKGFELKESQEGYIDNIDMDKPGIGGYGIGVDLGIVANIRENLSVSAALLDLGSIRWNKSSNTSAIANDWHTLSPEDAANCNILDYNLVQLQTNTKNKSRKTSLFPTLNAGIEYGFWHNRVGIGLLSSTTFYKPDAYSELTASINFRPGSWFGTSLSYSFLHSDFKTFGFGIRLGPLFLATDYMITNKFDTIECMNAYLGINFPIGNKSSKLNKKIKSIKK